MTHAEFKDRMQKQYLIDIEKDPEGFFMAALELVEFMAGSTKQHEPYANTTITHMLGTVSVMPRDYEQLVNDFPSF